MKEPSKEQIKERAKFLRQVLLEKHKIELPHGHALEVLAKVFGYNDWNTASALSSKTDDKVINEKPLTAKLQTTGDAVDFLSIFPKETKLVVTEYCGIDSNSNNLGLGRNITSVCSLTYDYEIQNETELRLELNTEEERNEVSIGKSATQTFDQTAAGRSQRRIKLNFLKSSFWNPRVATKSDQKT